jgi:hypothetical protein
MSDSGAIPKQKKEKKASGGAAPAPGAAKQKKEHANASEYPLLVRVILVGEILSEIYLDIHNRLKKCL